MADKMASDKEEQSQTADLLTRGEFTKTIKTLKMDIIEQILLVFKPLTERLDAMADVLNNEIAETALEMSTTMQKKTKVCKLMKQP